MTHVAYVLWGGFIMGLLFGSLGRWSNFCLTGGLREWWSENQTERAGAFALAMAVALAGSQLVADLNYVELRRSLYVQSSFSWLLVPLGGVLFGYGMMVARGCGSRALILLGDGNLRSLVVLLSLGIAASITLTGLLAPLRVSLMEATTWTLTLPEPTLSGVLMQWGVGEITARWAVTLTLSLALGAFALFWLRLIRAPRHLVGGFLIGLLIPASWVVTGHLGADDFEPVAVESLTFVAPIGNAIQYVMLSTGIPAGFGVTMVGGVLLGSLVVSVATRTFELRGFDSPGHMLRSIAGGAFMGIGGALAIGCSIGQGLSGLSTLAIPSFFAVAGIFLGAWVGYRTLKDL